MRRRKRVFIIFMFSLVLVDFISLEAEAEMKVIKRKMTIEQVHKELKEGITREEVEAYFKERKIPFSFSTRATVDQMSVPKFKWKSPDAIGLIGGVIQNNGRTWWLIIIEDLRITAEINSEGKVSQVVAEYIYTGP